MKTLNAHHGPVSWSAAAAWGAGLIQLALGAGALTAARGDALLIAVGIAAAGLGAASLTWGAIALGRGRLIASRTALAGAVAAVVVAAIALAVDPQHVSVVAVAAALLLVVTGAVPCAFAVRRERAARAPESPVENTVAARQAPGVRMLGLIVSAVIVAAVATPAMHFAQVARLAGDGQPATILQHHH